MLIEFSVGNYLSFKDKATFSMVAAKVSAKETEIDAHNVFKIDEDFSLLKSAAIYGANASGKSNLAAAMGFMKWFVLNSSKETQVTEKIDVQKFRLSTETETEASFFEIIFIIDRKTYRYGFEVDTERVVSEWLFRFSKTKETKLFERNLSNFNVLTGFKEGKELIEKTRKNALFLSVVAQFNGKIAQKIMLWFSQNLNLISGLHHELYNRYTIESFENNQHKQDILEFVKKLDVGIEDIQINNINLTEDLLHSIPEELRTLILRSKSTTQKAIKTVHKKYDSEGKPTGLEVFDIDSESEGTKKLFALAGPIFETLKNGEILLIDELDSKLHPLITSAIISLFNSNETNPKNAQLIFITHDTNILTNKIFRKDQIWFTEKDKQGATHLFSLVEYKLKNEDSFESDYIRGRYGAIPFIGDLRQLIGKPNEQKATI
ncbi:MAG TPA: ATP-binding protein [Halomicronema sp.]